MRVRTDLNGKTFGRLTAICQDGVDTSGKNARWKCVCECGNIKYANRPDLIQGHTRSCGCIVSPNVDDYNELQKERFFRHVRKTEFCWYGS
jgi:hypothetical protein